MAYGQHWEWRGFGAVSACFASRFAELPPFYRTHRVVDEYLWIPGLAVNAKFREGIEEGLKFKRMLKKKGSFEVWEENEEDLFEFPLGMEAWHTLGDMLEQVNLALPDYPPVPPGREATTRLLTATGCRTIKVQKERETRLWQDETDRILVEWTSIARPQRCLSIGLENWSDDPEHDLTDDRAQNGVRRALDRLGLAGEPLAGMNYLGAVEKWITGNKL